MPAMSWKIALPVAAILGWGLMVADVSSGNAPWQQPRKARAVATPRAPAQHVTRFGDHEIRQLDLPVSDGYGGTEYQRCFVWRDAEFKTATLSCPSEQDGALPDLRTPDEVGAPEHH